MAWMNEGGENIYKQDRENSCGPACVVMILRLMESRIFDASYVRGAFGEEEGSANITKEGVRDFKHTPSANDIVNSVLNRYTKGSWRSVFHTAYLKKYMDYCTDSQPAVLYISWTHEQNGANWNDISDRGYGHWVVLKETVGPDYRILDPGGVVNTVPISTLTDYLVHYDNGSMFGNIEGILTTR